MFLRGARFLADAVAAPQMVAAAAMVAAATGALCMLTACGSTDSVVPPTCTPTEGRVARILDGDTIELEETKNGSPVRVRYLLADTPETADNPADSECFAEEARLLNEELVLGRVIELEYDDGLCTEIFGRNIAYVFVDGHMVNRILMERGYARLLIVRPEAHPGPYVFEDEFAELERLAENGSRGLWGVCE